MTSGDPAAAHERLMALFDALCDAPEAEQARGVDDLRRSDAELAGRLVRMLAADRGEPDGLLDQAGGAATLVIGFAGVVAGERWRLVAPIGRGGGGEVWRAEDALGGPDVAVKLIDPALMASPRQVRRFRREFRALSRLDHDGCLRVLDEGTVDDRRPNGQGARRYIAMEYVAGGDLTRLVRAPERVLLPVLLQVAGALDYIHRQQIVHRDLKPANVLLTSEDPPRAKLADFGVIKLSEQHGSQLTDGGTLIGTLDYLSPEQVRGEPVDPRSDLYALGCLIHALWTGDVPFGGNRMERLWARVDRDAPSLASVAPGATPALCALTDELLRADPERRPQSANEVVRRLYGLMPTLPEGSLAIAARDAVLPVGHGAFLFPPGLVGRDETMTTLLAEAHRARSAGCAHLVAVVAPAGLGKTTVVTAISRRLAAEGWRTVRVDTTEHLGRAAFEPMPTLLGRLEALAPAPPAPVAPPQEGALSRVRPEQDVIRAAQRLAGRVAARLETLAEAEPVCVVLDDLHHASAGAVAVLTALVDRLASRAAPVLLLGTGRPQVRPLIDAVPGTAIVELAPLDPASSARVIARILGASPGELPAELTDPLVEEAGGSPLLLRAAMRELAESGGLRRTHEGWSIRPGESARAAVVSLLERRLAELDGPAREVLEAGAVLGVRFDADLVAAMAGVGEETLLDALSEGVRLGIIAPSTDSGGGDAYVFDHARLAELTLGGLGASEVAALHDAAGRALLARDAPVAALAYHFGRGTDARLAIEHLAAAVAEARAAHDIATVAALLAQSLLRVDDLDPAEAAPRRRALAEDYADALVTIGRHGDAATLFQQLEEGAVDDLERGRLLRKRGLALLRTSEPGRGVAALEGALTLLGDRTPRTRTMRLARLGWDFVATVVGTALPARAHTARRHERASAHHELALMYRWVDLYDSGAHLARFYRLAGRRAPTEFQVDANAMATLLFALRSMPRAGAFVQRRARELAQSTGDLVGLARLTIIQGACEAMLQDAETALDRLDQGVDLARQAGDPWLLCFALSQRAWVRGLVGSVPQANREFDQSIELAREIGAGWLEADATAGGMLSALAVGKVAEGERAARTLLTSDVRLAFPVFEQLAVEGMAGVAFVSGRFATALSGYERAYELLRQHRLDEGWGWLVPMELVEAACCLADEAGAQAVPRLVRRLKRAERAMRRMSSLPLYNGCVQVARGVIASRRGRADAAHARFARAASERGEGRKSYMDTWFAVRPALERLHLGASRDAVKVELDAVDAEYAARGLDGMQAWLSAIRKVNSV